MASERTQISEHPMFYKRISNALLWVGMLALLFGALLQVLLRFEGLLYVALDRSEDVVVRRADHVEGGYRTWSSHVRMHGLQSIPFNLGDTARAFYPEGAYDVAQLPFRLRLDAVELLKAAETQYGIVTRAWGVTQEATTPADDDVAAQPIDESATVALGEDVWEVEAIRPWTGLMHNPGGPPMANITLHIGDTAWEDIFLHEGEWLVGNGPTALRFDWFDSEDAALDAFPASPPGPETGRWGVEEGPGIHWIQSFLPGSGVTLNDGAEVTLLDFEADFTVAPEADYDARFAYQDYMGPALLVQIDRGEAALRRLITPEGILHTERNAAATPEDLEQAPTITMEYPAAYPIIIYLHAWRDGAAWAQVFYRGKDDGFEMTQALLEESPDLQAATLAWEGDASLRLEQLFAQALPVDMREEIIYEAVLRNEAMQRHRLRQGEWLRFGDDRVRLVVEQKPARTVQSYTVYTPGENRSHEVSLKTGGAVQYGGWRFTQAHTPLDAAQVALLEVERRPSGPLWIKGVLLLCAGCIGRGFLWYCKRCDARAAAD